MEGWNTVQTGGSPKFNVVYRWDKIHAGYIWVLRQTGETFLEYRANFDLETANNYNGHKYTKHNPKKE